MSVGTQFADALTTHLVEQTTASWNFWFGLLLVFQEREKHCNVPRGHKEGDYSLGAWVTKQRFKKDTLTPERRQRLDKIGFDWDPINSQWEEGFAALLIFKKREKHCNVHYSYIEGVYPLGSWVKHQRRIKDSLSKERKKRLEALKGWVWSVR
jgi:hypothetical protein